MKAIVRPLAFPTHGCMYGPTSPEFSDDITLITHSHLISFQKNLHLTYVEHTGVEHHLVKRIS